jgi:hypothetical protein
MKRQKSKQSSGMQIFVGIVMAILLVVLVNLGISAFYPAPNYPICDYSADTCSTQQATYTLSTEQYQTSIFWFYSLLGGILMITGLFLAMLMFNIIGLSAGAVLIIQASIMNYNINKQLSFLVILFVFVVLGIFSWIKFSKFFK